VKRCGYQRFLRRRWPKLTAVVHTRTHLFAAAVVTDGPSQDSPQLPEAMRQAARHLRPQRLLADKGYDAEHNHVLCRQELGVRSTVIPLNRRRAGRKWPCTRYRRQMKRCFPKHKYRQRVQAESAFSRFKRRLGSALTTRSHAAPQREIHGRVLTHNLMILQFCA